MLELAICDDEKSLRLDLRHVLETTLELQGTPFHLSEFDSGESFLTSACSIHYDIIFLDIEMKRLDGVATAKKLREQNKTTVIIFVTSHPDYVFQGYEVRAFNYILKPYQKEKILTSLQLALEELHISAKQFYMIEQKSGSVKLPLDDVLYFMSDRRSLTAFTKNSPISFYGKLNDLELELPTFFIRTHNRYLVNINYVTVLEANSLVCGSESLPVSRSYKQDLSIAFTKHMLN